MGKRRTLLNAQRPRNCDGKVIYEKLKDARGAASRARKRSGHANIQHYKCVSHSHYHIGHQSEYRQRALADAAAAKLSGKGNLPGSVGSRPVARLEMGEFAGSLWSAVDGAEEGV